MARGKRTDIETKAKIIEEKINTNAQWSDIARELQVPERTVQHILSTEFAEVCGESQKVANLIDRNDRLQSLADKMIETKIVSGEENVKISELVALRNSTFNQNQLLSWKPTENIRIEDFSNLSEKELEEARNSLL